MLGSGYVSQVCFGYVSGMFRGVMSYFTCNFRGMLRGMFSGNVSRVCNPCALLKPGPPQNGQTHTSRGPLTILTLVKGVITYIVILITITQFRALITLFITRGPLHVGICCTHCSEDASEVADCENTAWPDQGLRLSPNPRAPIPKP